MLSKLLVSPSNHYGPDALDFMVRWAPSGSATQTLLEAHGVASVSRTSAGLYVLNLAEGFKDVEWAMAQEIENDTAGLHKARVESFSVANKTITVSHKYAAWADLGTTGLAASDTVDQLQVYGRVRRAA